MIVKRGLGIDVVQAARNRIVETFDYARQENMTVQFGFSGGKDSIVLADILYGLVTEGKIDKSRLLVFFVDEEAMFDDVIRIVKLWRQKFMEVGVRFEWYCVQVKHFNCLNAMSEEENFICWDEAKKDVWVRERPKFAITDDEFLIPYKDNYQSWLDRKCAAYRRISMRGVRVAESVQRLKNMVKRKTKDISLPIYDMSDKDVWLYILKHNLDFPEVYENLYRVGRSKKDLRISQFFSADTAKVLVTLGEMYPDLMERVTKREPNAYLCLLYWDTEMFGRSSRKRRELEKDDVKKDYKKLVFDFISDPKSKEHYSRNLIKPIRNMLLRQSSLIVEDDYRKIYECIIKGDPKFRTIRGISTNISSRRNV